MSVITTHPYGQKSLELACSGYSRVKPALPDFSRPYGYVAPYVERADTLGDGGLHAVETRFPIVKQELPAIRVVVADYVTSSIQTLKDRYDAEYEKSGEKGYIASGKALVTTGLFVTGESLGWLSSQLSKKKDELLRQGKEDQLEQADHH